MVLQQELEQVLEQELELEQQPQGLAHQEQQKL
jgi:hypothetical protein